MFGKLFQLLLLLKDVIPAIIDLFKKKPALPQNEPDGKCPEKKSE